MGSEAKVGFDRPSGDLAVVIVIRVPPTEASVIDASEREGGVSKYEGCPKLKGE